MILEEKGGIFMNNFLSNLMRGRYGFDQLSQWLIGFDIILMVIGIFINNPYLSLVSYIPLVIVLVRCFSRNIAARARENAKFVQAIRPLTDWFRKKINRLKGQKTHRYYYCPKCRQTVRVPKGKGKICITCPKCHEEFIKKT